MASRSARQKSSSCCSRRSALPSLDNSKSCHLSMTPRLHFTRRTANQKPRQSLRGLGRAPDYRSLTGMKVCGRSSACCACSTSKVDRAFRPGSDCALTRSQPVLPLVGRRQHTVRHDLRSSSAHRGCFVFAPRSGHQNRERSAGMRASSEGHWCPRRR